MEDRAQGGKEEDRGDHKPDCANTNFRKNEVWLSGEAWGPVPNRRSTCAPYHMNTCMRIYSSDNDLPVSLRYDLAL